MRKITNFSLVVILLCGLTQVITYAQNTLDHSTGSYAATVFDNGFFGHSASGSGGNGIFLSGGPDAMYTASFLIGSASTRVSGYAHSLTQVTGSEMVNSVPFSGFSSDANFNQIATGVFSDVGAPTVNRTNLTVTQKSYSNTGDKFIIAEFVLTNNTGADLTGIYGGLFADWDVGVANYTNNLGGYDPSRNLTYQYEIGGAVDTRYYGVVALSGIAGARVTTYDATTTAELRDSAYQWMTTFLNESITSAGDYRTFIGTGPYNIANGNSVKIGFAFVGGSDLADLNKNSDAALSSYNNNVLPVELSSFTATAKEGYVELNWITATEKNNRVFEIERKQNESEYKTLGFVNGSGTSIIQNRYSFKDQNIAQGIYLYRLKQIDLNGRYEYSEVIEVKINSPSVIRLEQNYPNPFNPITKIRYSIPNSFNKTQLVQLKIYDALGKEIAILVNKEQEPGDYEIVFDAKNIPSGVYFYQLKTTENTRINKMLLLK